MQYYYRNNNRIKLEPDEDLEGFYKNNKQILYEFMGFELNRDTELQDRFSDQHK